METLWFMIVAVMVAAYVVLDGFDLGAGAIYLGAGKTIEDRRKILRAIGPVWDGNEVWLLAAGGTLYFAFPLLYASSFSGFYLPLMMVLWLLMLRGIGIELRAHMENAVWVGFFDLIFCVSSVLLAIFFGAALGNVVRGRIFLRAAVDQLSRQRQYRNPRLVYRAHGRDRARDSDGARVFVYRSQNRWRVESAHARHCVVGMAGAINLDYRRFDCDLLRATDRSRQLQATCHRISHPIHRAGKPGRDDLWNPQRPRQTGICRFSVLYRGNAGGCGFRLISRGAAGEY
jgi:hypothetical protein